MTDTIHDTMDTQSAPKLHVVLPSTQGFFYFCTSERHDHGPSWIDYRLQDPQCRKCESSLDLSGAELEQALTARSPKQSETHTAH